VNECRRFEEIIESLDDPQALSTFLGHTRGCETCRSLLATHNDLAATGARAPEPDEAELDLRQEQVLREIKRRRTRRPLRLAALAASLVVAFLAGALAGGMRGAPSSPRLVDALHAEAAGNRGLTDVENSPFSYSNVSFRRIAGDRVALDFDVTTHLAVVEPPTSPLVREVLAQSLLSPSSLGERLKAVSLAAGKLEPKLEEAVLFALRRDESVAVRLAALDALAGRVSDAEVQDNLMSALRDDPSVQVRLAALELLVSQRVEHRRIREAIGEREQPGGEALMVRLAELERQP
jgi:hypothetical protein